MAILTTDNSLLKIEYKYGTVTELPYEDNTFDVVWGEDAWCYVDDKEKVIAEAMRVLKPGGTLAFTDWIEGPAGLTDEEAMKALRTPGNLNPMVRDLMLNEFIMRKARAEENSLTGL